MLLSRFLFLVMLSLASVAAAQDESPATQPPQSVVIEVMLYRGTETYEIENPSDVDLEAFQMWLEEQKKVEQVLHWSKVRLQTLEGYEAMLMCGDMTPTVSSRTNGGSRGGTVSYQMRETGTHISVMPERDEEGQLRLTLELDKSSLSPGMPSDDAIPPMSIKRLTLQTTLVVKSGHTVVDDSCSDSREVGRILASGDALNWVTSKIENDCKRSTVESVESQ